MKYKFVTTSEWNYRGNPEEHYERSCVQPYKKCLKEYIPFNVIGGAGADGIEIEGSKTLKEAILKGFMYCDFIGFNKKQKRHLKKVLTNIRNYK